MSAVMDATKAALSAIPRAYATNSVPPGPSSYPYGSYWASLGEGATRLLTSDEGLRYGRIVTQSFAKDAGHALDHAEAIRAALVGRRFVLDGKNCSPVVNELPPSVVRDSDDNGVVAVTATYTFTKEQP